MRIGLSRRLLAVALTLATAGCARSGHVGGERAVGGAPQNPQRTIAPPIPGGVPVPVGRGQGDTPNADLAASAARLVRGRPGGAAPLYERAAGQEEAGGDRARLAVDLSSLALAYAMLGRRDEAGRTYGGRCPARGDARPRPPGGGAVPGEPLGPLLARGAAAEARPLAERALAIAEAALGPDDPKTALARRNLALMTPGPSEARDGGGAVPDAAAARRAARAARPRRRGRRSTPAARGTAGEGRFALQLAAVPERSGVAAEWRR